MMKKQGTPTDKNHPLNDGDGCLGPSQLQNKVKGHIPLNPREKKIPLNTSPLKIKEKEGDCHRQETPVFLWQGRSAQ